MTPWKPGDPIGAGIVYLPDAETRAAYHAADQLAKKTAMARRLLNAPVSEARRISAALTEKHGSAYVESLRVIAREIQSQA